MSLWSITFIHKLWERTNKLMNINSANNYGTITNVILLLGQLLRR